jgi:uncharacterized delta-60 repeat protein
MLLFGTGCDSMLQDHPIDTNKSTLELSIVLGYLDYLNQPLTTVSGKVILCTLNGSGNPNVKVTLNGKYENHETYTDSLGNFSLNNVRASDYILAVSKQGHHFQPETQTLSVGANGMSYINIETLITWEKTIGGEGWDKAYSIKQTNDCGYIVVGYSDSDDIGNLDFDIIKLDINGVIGWDKKFGGSGSEIAYSVIQTNDGRYAATGYTYSYGSGLNDFWIVKLYSNGDLNWQKVYGGTEWEEARSIRQTSDNGYIIAGFTETYGAGASDFWIVKLDENGNYSWDHTYGGAKSDEAFSIQETSDNGYVVCGTTETGENGDKDILVIKLDNAGGIVWSKTYNKGLNDEANEVLQTSEGGYIIVGSAGEGFGNIWILKLKEDGSLEWEKVYGNTYTDKAYSVQQTSDGGYILCGYTYSFTTADNDMLIMKLDSQGQIEWQRTFDSNEHGEDVACSIRQTADGGYIVAGHTYRYLTKKDMWLFKLNRNGELE